MMITRNVLLVYTWPVQVSEVCKELIHHDLSFRFLYRYRVLLNNIYSKVKGLRGCRLATFFHFENNNRVLKGR